MTAHVTSEAVSAAVRAYEVAWDCGINAGDAEWMRAALESAAPLLGPRPLLDWEAVKRVINEARALPATHSSRPSIEAVLELARPMPTREQIAGVLADHDADSVIDCTCGWRDDQNDEDLLHHQADGVLALLTGGQT